MRPGSEEYLESEKYQLRPRDYAAAAAEGQPMAGLLTRLNIIRREHESLHWLRNLRFHQVDNAAITAFSKRSGDDTVLVICSTDPHNVQAGWTNLDMWQLGYDWSDRFIVRDLLRDVEYEWGQFNFVSLDPATIPAHIFSVRPVT
jgi:starch synthase (maltosyl-transferring)